MVDAEECDCVSFHNVAKNVSLSAERNDEFANVVIHRPAWPRSPKMRVRRQASHSTIQYRAHPISSNRVGKDQEALKPPQICDSFLA